LSRIRFDDVIVLAFFLGPRPTMGYQVAVDAIKKSGPLVVVYVVTTTPSPPLMNAVTSPCLFISIQRAEWQAPGRIIVKDVNGTTYVDMPVNQ